MIPNWVLIDWQGMVCCPWHGELAPEQEYVAGRALCGCEFQPAAGGKLRAVQLAAVDPEPAAQPAVLAV